MRVAIFPNLSKTDALKYTIGIGEFLEQRGVEVVLPPDLKGLAGDRDTCPPSEWSRVADYCVVLGGDGTLLSAVRATAPGQIPLLGVNLGHLGFLTEVETPDLFPTLDKFLRGEFFIERRSLLDVRRLRKADGGESRYSALNEVVVAKGPFARLIRVNIWVDDRYIDTFPGDGVIVATATGSTAYSLSAGGPLVSPEVDCMLVTPVCPHSLYSRTMVISGNSKVGVSFAGLPEHVFLTTDGQDGTGMDPGDMVLVYRAERQAHLVRLKDWNFFEVLRRKMKEGHGASGYPDDIPGGTGP
jgi:NAD+ kinase